MTDVTVADATAPRGPFSALAGPARRPPRFFLARLRSSPTSASPTPSSESPRGAAGRRGPEGRLPGEASPAKVAKDGQHNNDDDDDPKPGRHRDPFVRNTPILRRADRHVQRAADATAQRVSRRAVSNPCPGSSTATLSSARHPAPPTGDRHWLPASAERSCSVNQQRRLRSARETTDDERSQRPARAACSDAGTSSSSYSDARPRAITGQA
jgi:hypothetical protein